MIEFDETIRAIVYCHFSRKGDFMVGFNEKDGKIIGIGRVRWYREDTGDPFRDNDEKNWMQMREQESLDAGIALTVKTCNELQDAATRAGFEPVGGREEIAIVRREEEEGVEDFMERFKKLPFVHSKTVTRQ